MKQYKIYTDPSGTTQAVKQGWSWPAFFFNAIWALVKQIWLLGLLTFPVMLLLWVSSAAAGNVQGESGQIISGMVSLAWIIFKIIFGAGGNSWREKNLTARGFKYVATVSASNPNRAMALHLAPVM